jgi:hypothetical protein
VTIPKNDTRKDYIRYAEHCLNMVTAAKDQDSRALQREMAAEWMELVEAILQPPKPTKYNRIVRGSAANVAMLSELLATTQGWLNQRRQSQPFRGGGMLASCIPCRMRTNYEIGRRGYSL